MAGFIRYEQAPVTITEGSEAACEALATTVTAGENLPLQAVRALGYNGAVAVTANGPVDGTWSMTYHMVKKVGASMACSGSSTEITTCDEFYKGPAGPLTWGFDNQITLNVAETDLFTQGMANSMTITAEPNAIITATLAGNFYDCRLSPDGGALEPKATTVGKGDYAVAHGSATVAGASVDVGFSCDPFSISYEASRGFNPIYSLGSLTPKFVMITDPQQSITMQGENIPASVLASNACTASDDPLCLSVKEADFTINDVCGNEIAAFSVCGFIQSRDIEVAENDALRGNVTIVDYTFAQELGAAVTC